MVLGPVERGLLFLYHHVTSDLDEEQLRQFLDPADAAAVTDSTFEETLPALRTALDLETRRDRYAAVLAYVLGVRADDGTADTELNLLGGDLLARFSDVPDAFAQEADLRDAVGRLSVVPVVDEDVADKLERAFDPVLQVSLEGDGAYQLQGAGAELAMMFLEISSMDPNCRAREGHIDVAGKSVPVTLIEYELCHNAPFERCKPGVDPRNWPLYNPSFFRRVDVVRGSPAATGNWAGTIREQVGIIGTNPIVTNLDVTYIEGPDMAVTVYDLAADSQDLPPDDGKVVVDYGVVAVYDEGTHVRFRALKVVAMAKKGSVAPPHWLCPLWAHQVVLTGWWSWAP